MEAMTYRPTKWIIFTALFLTIPALLFLGMAVMFMPAVFFVAGIGYVISKLFKTGPANESLVFIAILTQLRAFLQFQALNMAIFR
jgi:hypothetical protein